ncbi:MAG: endopeptidase La [Christensenellaceae bacterium]|nr:endopeptidase La [Christensenellaceae bacterium]
MESIDENKENNNFENNDLINIPVLALKGINIFPNTSLHFDVQRKYSKQALKLSIDSNKKILLVMQKGMEDSPELKDIHLVGTICSIKQVLELPGNIIRVLVVGENRARILNLKDNSENFEAEAIIIKDDEITQKLMIQALINSLKSAFKTYSENNRNISPELIANINVMNEPVKLTDIIASNCIENLDDRQSLIEKVPLTKRMELLYGLLIKQVDILKLERRIQERVKSQIEKNQRDFYLNEQIKSIQEELGNTNAADIDLMRKKLEQLPLNEEAREKVENEINRYSHMMQGSPELVVSRTYIEYILDLPWGKYTDDELDLGHAKKILDSNHYGLEKVKERIIEFIAVLHQKKNMRGPILCFVGPPGVGKTSVVRAIAEALGRKFVQMSLGGVRDEAEIRGHRRTYVSAIPGRIIAGIKQSGTMNPLFLFDEIDKMSSDFRGDPASAMLEVLDSEQNYAFRDHYLEIPFDLSNVMFITTANSTDSIPPALLDRLEIIEVSSYTLEEKLQISKKHLLPKQIIEHGLKGKAVRISDKIFIDIIEHYTRESGVRQLERIIAKIVRKSIVDMHNKKELSYITITKQRLKEYLGSYKFLSEQIEREPKVGIVNGLAYTAFGGVVLAVECATLKGSGKIHLTGKLGDVMKESADAALSWIRAHYKDFELDEDFFQNTDIHIHVPEGAVPKDGPSAGVTMAIAMISALTNTKVRQDIAMTGEITLRGNVLPIGGVKEKLFSAYRNKIYNIFLPCENMKDLEELPKDILNELNIISVKSINDIIKEVFVDTKGK